MKESVSEPIEKSFDLQEAPEGWQIALTEDISQIVGGGTPKTSDNSNFSEDGYPWITPADLNGFSGMYINRGKRSLSAQGLRTSSAVLMPKGTVLMSSRAPIGYLAIAANELCTNQGFKSFICHQGVVPEYVFLWLKFITPFLENMGSGSTFLEISGTRARKIPILLAPTSEQKRIVAKVEELLARVNSAKERLNKVSVILKRFRQAVLSAACSGRLTADWREQRHGTNRSKWATVDFFDFCVLQRGYDLPIAKREDGPFPIVTSGGIIAYHAQYRMSGPGVLVGRSGSIGKFFYVEKDFWPHNTTLFVKDFRGNVPKYV